MNREIKFRAYSDFGKKMYHITESEDLWSFIRRVHGMVLMQYTGLKDRNGKEIYEGDIVNCDMSYDSVILPHRGEIIYVNKVGAFATKNQAGETLLHYHILSSFEVIGNVHENPELL